MRTIYAEERGRTTAGYQRQRVLVAAGKVGLQRGEPGGQAGVVGGQRGLPRQRPSANAASISIS